LPGTGGFSRPVQVGAAARIDGLIDMGGPIRMFNSLELICTMVLLTTYFGTCGEPFVALG